MNNKTNNTTKTNNKSSKRRIKPYSNICCPRCGSHWLHKYGKDQKTKLQKYRCIFCKKQFIPEKSKTQKTPKHGLCLLCNKPLEIRKTNKNSIQLRCSSRPNCKFTISFNFKLKKFFFDAINQKDFFKLPKFFKFPFYVLLTALRLYFKYKLPLRQIKAELKYRYPNIKPPSHVTIAKWANKCSFLLSLALSNKHFLHSNKWFIWSTDETVIKINGIKYYLIVVMDYLTGVILSWFLSPTRDTQAIKFTLQLALNLTKSKPIIIISDFAQNIQNAVQLTFANSVSHYKTSIYSNSIISNNKLERFFSKLKSKLNNRRNFKSTISAYAFLCTFFIMHNINLIQSQNNSIINSLTNYPLAKEILSCIAY